MDLLRATSKLAFPPIVLHSDLTGGRIRPERRRRRISWRLDSDAVAQLCADYLAGLTTRELADRYEVGKTAVTRLLRERHVPLRHQGLSSSQVQRAAELYAAGSSVAQVGEALGFHPSSVFDPLKRADLVLRDRHAQGRQPTRSTRGDAKDRSEGANPTNPSRRVAADLNLSLAESEGE